MTKQHFIALADAVRNSPVPFTDEQLEVLIGFCLDQNSRFSRSVWLGYLRGECGPSGGKPKPSQSR